MSSGVWLILPRQRPQMRSTMAQSPSLLRVRAGCGPRLHRAPTSRARSSAFVAWSKVCRSGFCWLHPGLPCFRLQTIADEISHNLDFLEAELRDLPERHHSLRAVFTQSWQRLTATERTVFMRLAVFRRGFTRQAAQSVAGASLHTLRVLVNQSLLQVEQGERYTLHELLRQYAATELAAAQQSAATHARHCAYYLDWLAQRAGDLTGPRQAVTIGRGRDRV